MSSTKCQTTLSPCLAGVSACLVTRHTGIFGELLTPVSAQRTRTGFRLLPLCLHPFPFICVFAFRTAKVPMVVRCSVLADEPLPAALTSANSRHLKKPPKIKRIKIEVIRGCWEKGHPSPRPSSRFIGLRKMPVSDRNRGSISAWETGNGKHVVPAFLEKCFLKTLPYRFSLPYKQELKSR